MFSVITNIYNKKTKGPTLMEFFIAIGKLKKFFLTTRDFDVCTMGDTAHIDTIFKFLPHTLMYVWQEKVICGAHISSCQKKKNFFIFPVAVNNSIKVFLL